MKAIAVRPLVLDMENLSTRTQIAAQRQQILNQLLKQGSTNLLNFGKNTQWAGRQLMVGFTIPLSIFGATAAKSFMTIEEQAIRFRRVYGDLMTDPGQTEDMLDSIKELASEFTKYGVAVDKTLGLAASAAAQGKTGADLTAQVAEATRLSVLGQVDEQKALETTISVTNAFGVASEDLATKIDFLNAVENQTVTSIEDLTTAIPKAGPVVKQLGGDVEDLAFFLTAMKEGGINASEGANALKSGLASLINPTEKASSMLAGFGININGIVEANKGDVKSIVIDFAEALDKLDPLTRARAIEQLFGKFQFSRLSTLFQNVIGEGTQAERVLQLAATSSQGLAELSARELGKVSESSMFKFKKSIEDIKVALAPIGETFLKLATPVIEFGTKVLNAFNSLDERTKGFVAGLVGVVGGIGPILLMTFGLLANGVANIIKGFTFVKNVFNGASVSSNDLGSQISYMTTEQVKAASVAASLDQVHTKLTQTFTSEANAILAYTSALQRANAAAAGFNVPMVGRARPVQKMAKGGMVRGPGGPKDDLVPTDLSNGEAVIDAATVKKNPRIIAALFSGKKIQIPGYSESNSPQFRFLGSAGFFNRQSPNAQAGNPDPNLPGAKASDIVGDWKRGGAGSASPLLVALAKKLEMSITAKSIEKNPQILGDLKQAGEKIVGVASNAVLNSGKQFVKDADIEGAVVPALKTAAKGITLGGKNISSALDSVLQDFNVVTMKGIKGGMKQSGAQEASARARIPGTDNYIANREKSQMVAKKLNPEVFGTMQLPSKSRPGTIKNWFSMLDPLGNKEKAQVSHIQTDRPATYEDVKRKAGTSIDKVTRTLGSEAVLKAIQIEQRGVVEGVEKATRQKSPSKDAYNAGANIGKGAIQGIESQIDDAQRVGRKNRRVIASPDGQGGLVVQSPATQSSSFAATPAGRTARRATAPQTNYASIDVSAKNASAALNQVAKVSQTSRFSMLGLNNALSIASMGVSGLSGAAMMFGVANNKAVSAVNAVSTGLFGLSSIMSMFGGTSLQGFLGDRKKKATIAARAAGAFGGNILGSAKQPGVAGAFKNFGGMLARAAIFVARFIGPIGLAVAGLTVLAGVIKFAIDQQEKERRKIEGLGDAALLTKDKLSTLGEIFGVSVSKSPLERATLSAPMKREDRQQVDVLRESQDFKDKFATDIKSLSEATTAEAKIALESIAIQLEGSGFAESQISQIVSALKEESGKTSIKLDFKSISLNTETGKELLGKNAKELASQFSKAYAENIIKETRRDVYRGRGGVVENIIQTDEFKKQSVTAGKTIAGLLVGISTAFASGNIDAEGFSKSLESVTSGIQSIPEPQQLILMDGVLRNMDSPLATAATRVSNLSDKYLLLQAAMLGVNTLSESELKVLERGPNQVDGGAQRAYARIKLRLTNSVKSFKKIYDDYAKEIAGGTDDPDDDGGGEESRFEKALKQIAEQTNALLEQTKAFNKLKAAGYETEEAFEIAKDPILAAALASTKVGSKEWKLLTKAIRASKKAAEEFEEVQRETLEGATKEFEDSYSKVGETFSALQEGLQIAFDKANKADNDLISGAQSRIAGLEYTLDDLNATLDDIQIKEDAINEKYDKRIDALDKIQSANDEIARQQKSQLNIADALSQGDIAAAAKAVQEARAESAQASLENQRKALDAARASEIQGITVGGKTKAQIEKEALEIQKQIKKIEEETLEPAQERVRLAEERLQKDVAALTVAGKTKDEWDLIANNIRIAKTQTDEFVASLMAAAAAAANLNDVLAARTSKVSDSSTGASTSSGFAQSSRLPGISGSSSQFGPNTPWARASAALGFGGGGMVPKYFAAGGFARGKDTVPAMLTPGEFIIKKSAVENFGVNNLRSINNGAAIGDSVYNNYELNVNVRSDANPSEIARVVISQIKQIDSQRIRGVRL
jgi:TP901 family phage tail tape measure protein